MTTIKLYSYLNKKHQRVYLGTPLVVNKAKHGDIIIDDQGEFVVFVQHGQSPRLRRYPATPYDIDKIIKAQQEVEAINAEVEATSKMTIAQLDRLNELEGQAAKPKPQFSFVGRGKPQPVSPEWAMYQYYLHKDYNDTISDFLAGTR